MIRVIYLNICFFISPQQNKVLNTSNVSIIDYIRLLEYKALILERQVVLPLFAVVFRLLCFPEKISLCSLMLLFIKNMFVGQGEISVVVNLGISSLNRDFLYICCGLMGLLNKEIREIT